MRRLIVAACVATGNAIAQAPVPVHEIGKLERVTTDSLRSAVEAVHMTGGRVLVNDPWSRLVLLFDSTLAHPIVVADTTAATGNAYGTHRGGIITRYHGDSALYVDEASLTMFVISPSGTLGRIMAFPQPPTKEAGGQLITGGETGPPGFDARGRLIYVNESGAPPGTMSMRGIGKIDPASVATAPLFSENMYVDSSFAFRVDLVSRKTDTIASVKKGKGLMRMRREDDHIGAIENAFDPLPVIDQWTILGDGTFAIVRGRDYHIDWLGGDGVWTSTPKMQFEWIHVSEDRKRELQDSVERAWLAQKTASAQSAVSAPPSGGGGRGGGAGGRGGDGSPPQLGASGPGVPNVAVHLPLDSIADYVPAFTRGAVRGDAEGNVWIRTTAMVGERPVYDVVDRRGQIVDRVQLPANRVIAGFGPGVVYMAVKDSTGNVRLERARVK